MLTLLEIAVNGGPSYSAPFKSQKTLDTWMQRAGQSDVSVEELLHWIAAHVEGVKTNFRQDDQYDVVDEVKEMIALAVVKLRRNHAACGQVKSVPPIRDWDEKVEYAEQCV